MWRAPAALRLTWICLGVAARPRDAPVVRLPFGPVQGNALASVSEFLGIPYAKAPVGSLRFAPTQPWTGLFQGGLLQATKASAACIQGNERESIWYSPLAAGISEDCLFLNIYTPDTLSAAAGTNGSAANNTELKPVMVWIHGGSLLMGAAALPTYNATHLVEREGVVVVTINYRLGVFGFLPTILGGTPVANNGFRDQIEALRWVREHIAAFGGNPDLVTVFGQSAGGQSIIAHLGNPATVGLFSRAISQSGNIDMIASMEEGLQQTRVLAKRLGCAGPEDLPCLREANATDVFAARPYCTAVIDGDTLRGLPVQLAEQGKLHRVPLLLGTNGLEASTFSYPGLSYPSIGRQTLKKSQAECVFAFGFGEEAKSLMEVYPPRETFGVFDNRNVVIGLLTDLMYNCPAMNLARSMAEQGADVWAYSFRRTPSCSPLKYPGPVHGAELAYVFANQLPMAEAYNSLENPDHCEVSPQDLALSRTITGLWSRFAREGAPSAAWPRCTASQQPVLKLDLASPEELATETGFRGGQCKALRTAALRTARRASHKSNLTGYLMYSLGLCQLVGRQRRLDEAAPAMLV